VVDLSHPWPFGLNRRTWPAFAAGLVLALVLLGFFDHFLSATAHDQSTDVINLFAEITRWGESDWLLYPSFALLVLFALLGRLLPDRVLRLAFLELVSLCGLIFVGVGLPSLVANLVKRLVGRGRPELFDSVGPLAFHPLANAYVYESFPSGHTTTAFAAAMVLGFLAPRYFGLGLLYAVAIGLSRLVVGAHYPTDVLAGAVLGTLGAYAVRNYFAFRRWGFERLPDGRIVARPPSAARRLMRRRQGRAAR